MLHQHTAVCPSATELQLLLTAGRHLQRPCVASKTVPAATHLAHRHAVPPGLPRGPRPPPRPALRVRKLGPHAAADAERQRHVLEPREPARRSLRAVVVSRSVIRVGKPGTRRVDLVRRATVGARLGQAVPRGRRLQPAPRAGRRVRRSGLHAAVAGPAGDGSSAARHSIKQQGRGCSLQPGGARARREEH